MPRYSPLEDLYERTYLCENDAQMQNNAMQQNSQNGQMPQDPTGEPVSQEDDYPLRRAILKTQEWVMFIDHNFPDAVDGMGGMAGFLNSMVEKMQEDEMIRPTQEMEPEQEEEYDDEEQPEEELTDDDIQAEVGTNGQQGPQSFKNAQNQ